ncbi:hypothetical protein [Embleya sp. NPDC059237]|uniref:hypothetical protein n=1 Tax=Embleya sp. NPDC059237 TaxID=3346784 RepID=UPI003688D8E2
MRDGHGHDEVVALFPRDRSPARSPRGGVADPRSGPGAQDHRGVVDTQARVAARGGQLDGIAGGEVGTHPHGGGQGVAFELVTFVGEEVRPDGHREGQREQDQGHQHGAHRHANHALSHVPIMGTGVPPDVDRRAVLPSSNPRQAGG